MRDLNIMRIPAALAFYKLFLQDMELGDTIDWNADEAVIAAQLQAAQAAGTTEIARQEIHNRYLTNWILERKAPAQKAIDTYTHSYATTEPPSFTAQPSFAKIDRVGNDAYSILEFTLEQDTRVNIYAMGEYWLGKMVDYGGIEDTSSGKLIWTMTPDRTLPAGGVLGNRQTIEQIALRAGTYRLHFRTDWGHSFNNWDGLPPDNLFWGIALYSIGDDVKLATRTIIPTAKDELLAGLLPLTDTPAISNLEYGILCICVGFLLSVLVAGIVVTLGASVEVRRISIGKLLGVQVAAPGLRWRKISRVKNITSTWRWTKFAAWVAWINSLLCLVQLLVMVMIAGHLEVVVENPLTLTSNATAEVRIFVGVSYVCILLAIAQVVFAVLAWKGKQHSLAERLYYSLATLAVSGYLLLLSSWGLIAALY